MAKAQNVTPDQRSLDELLDEQQGSLVPLPIESQEIGGELLAILSKGLYTNPLDCIREYVQNAVDAEADNVTIKVTGNSVMIFDDGQGMSLAELLEARQFALSRKSLAEHVGFRGIGIYSGFDLCQRLRITSKKAGDPRLHVMVFEFAAMRAVLDADRRRPAGQPKTSLIDLLSEHTFIKREPSPFPLDRCFTQVQLDNISDVHMRQLSNRAGLRRYLLQNLPVDFADDFAHKVVINEKLHAHVRGYKAIRITLQSDGLPDEVVGKYGEFNLQAPTYGFINTSAGQSVAYYWACLNVDRGKVQPRSRTAERDGSAEERPNYEGLVYKVKGFTIGDRQRIRVLWDKFNGKAQLYPWYTGEVYVLDPNVIPNAERDDFETNHAKTQLEFALRDVLQSLEKEAEEFQASGVANDRIVDYRVEVEQTAERVEANIHEDDFETFARLNVIKNDLKTRKKKASTENRQLAEQITKQIDRLQNQLRKDVDAKTSEGTRRKRAARRENVQDRLPVPAPVAPPPPAPPKTLHGVLRDAGWDVEGESARLADVIQSSLEDVLTLGSMVYRNVIDDIESKLSPNGTDQ